jgi:acetyltransferase-like isoleucine patch superfamily enzyme
LPEESVLAAGAVLSRKYTEGKVIYGGIPAIFIKKIN